MKRIRIKETESKRKKILRAVRAVKMARHERKERIAEFISPVNWESIMLGARKSSRHQRS